MSAAAISANSSMRPPIKGSPASLDTDGKQSARCSSGPRVKTSSKAIQPKGSPLTAAARRETAFSTKLELCLGARCAEVAGMHASEFAKDNKDRLLWTLPVERSKNKHARVTPILGLALEIITARLDRNEDILF